MTYIKNFAAIIHCMYSFVLIWEIEPSDFLASLLCAKLGVRKLKKQIKWRLFQFDSSLSSFKNCVLKRKASFEENGIQLFSTLIK